jgi:hypothetical protein
MKKLGLLILLLFVFSILNGCISNERFFQINIKSSHTWTLDIKVDIRAWENYSSIDSDPDFIYSEIKKLYVNEADVFDINIKLSEIGYIEIVVNAFTNDGFFDEYIISSFDIEEDYYFEIIGSGNEIHIINLN